MSLKEKEQDIKRFANESPCVCFNLRKATRSITSIYDELFRDIGITVTQASILKSLMYLGSLSVSQLAEAMATDRTTLTRNIKPLEREGLIVIRTGQDRRAKEITITPKGEDVSGKAGQKWEEFQKRVEATVGKEKLEQLCQDLSTTVEMIQKV